MEESKCEQAVKWIMAAPPGEKRTQAAAALKFCISQSVVSAAMKRKVHPKERPDARRGRRVTRDW